MPYRRKLEKDEELLITETVHNKPDSKDAALTFRCPVNWNMTQREEILHCLTGECLWLNKDTEEITPSNFHSTHTYYNMNAPCVVVGGVTLTKNYEGGKRYGLIDHGTSNWEEKCDSNRSHRSVTQRNSSN